MLNARGQAHDGPCDEELRHRGEKAARRGCGIAKEARAHTESSVLEHPACLDLTPDELTPHVGSSATAGNQTESLVNAPDVDVNVRAAEKASDFILPEETSQSPLPVFRERDRVRAEAGEG